MSKPSAQTADAVKSPQPPRISGSLKSRKRLLLLQKQGRFNDSSLIDASIVAEDTNRSFGFGSQQRYTEDVTYPDASQGSFTLAAIQSQRSNPHGYPKSLFSHMGARHDTKDASHLAPHSRQANPSLENTAQNNNTSINTQCDMINSPPSSFFGAVMSRSTVKADATVDSRHNSVTQDKTNLQQALMNEASSHALMHNQRLDTRENTDITALSQFNLSNSPDKGDPSSKLTSFTTTISSSFLTPNGKRKRMESSSDTPRRSILKDFGNTSSLKTVNWDMELQQDPTSRTFASPKPTVTTKSASPFSKFSPGGHSLWTMLQSFKSHDNIMIDDHVSNDSIPKETNITPHTQQNTDIEDEDWIEVPLSFSEETYKLHPTLYMDWTLKRSMTIDGYPHVPGTPIQQENHPIAPMHEAPSDPLAIQLLYQVDLSKIHPLYTQEEMSRAQWNSSLLYWQHPSNHPLPASILESYSPPFLDLSSKGSFKKGSSESHQQHILKDLQESMDALQHRYRLAGVGCLGGLGLLSSESSSSPDSLSSSFMAHRVQEWKECFQALFRKWLDQVLQYHHGSSNIPLSRLYFYSLCPGQTILFKGILDSESGHPTPLIVLSSTTAQTRHMLFAMGIQVRVWDETIHSFEILSMQTWMNLENPRKGSTKWKEDGKETLDGDKDGSKMNGSLKQADEQMQKRLAPIYIQGVQDCRTFFEYYWNTVGFQVSHGYSHHSTSFTPRKMLDVPLLLCRSLGPCIHTCLKSLSTWWKPTESQDSHHASLDIRGPILPCAVQDIIRCTIHNLLWNGKKENVLRGEKEGRDTEVGSHYFVAHLQCHRGEEIKDTAKALRKSNRIGMAGLILANDTLDRIQDKQVTIRKGCERGEFISTVVWDITRSSSIMCKRDC